MSRTILITGGAGFLGSHLVERLLAQGHRVIAYDNLMSGSTGNLQEFFRHPRFQFAQRDVIDPYDLQVDELFNFACQASPPRYQQDPLHTFKTSIFGALHAANIAVKHNTRILQASTSEIYGEPNVNPQPESYWGNVNPVGIRSCYDEGKRGAETLLTDYKRMHGIDVRIARIFNTYGPRMRPDDGRVVSNFIIQALTGKPLSIFGDGSQTRSFCYVDDLITGLLALMRLDAQPDGPVNLGNPEEFSVLELARLVLEKTGSRSRMEFHPLPSDDPTQRRPDISKARKLLDWAPGTRLEQGLEATIAYFDRQLSAAKAQTGAFA
ncbi:MAG: SDR family oxidoreductase [Alphaproteobacteria bacterium]|nr:SDR family oxidoreductase [Alphaproteobacteria bacterium]